MKKEFMFLMVMMIFLVCSDVPIKGLTWQIPMRQTKRL